MDDKAKVSVGEPGTPESASNHNRKALTKSNVELEASDHNYHVANLTPSAVTFMVDIPEEVTKSFFTGHIYVGIKDSIFQGSDPLRHIVELLNVVRTRNIAVQPYMCIFSDGGGDHNITFLFVQCVLLALFRILDLDVLNVGRCAPNQSFINPAERCMSILNIGMQCLSLERDHLGEYEDALKNCKSMKDIRTKAKKHQGLSDAFQTSLQSSIKKLENCYESMELKGKPVQTFQPSRDATEIVSCLSKIEPKIKAEDDIPHNKPKLPNYPSLQQFFSNHMNEGLYMLQFRKCGKAECCKLQSIQLPPKVPAPVPSPAGGHYMKFHELYGKVNTTEKDCPSLNTSGKDQKKKNDSG